MDHDLKRKVDLLSQKQDFQDFCMEAFSRASNPVLDLIAPQVDVAVTSGKCKVYGDQDPLFLPDTERPTGESASRIDSADLRDMYRCLPNGLEASVDLGTCNERELEMICRQNILMIASLSSASRTIKALALAKAAKASANISFADADDPVELMDVQIEAVLKAGQTGMCGIVFGATAWKLFKNHPKVAERVDSAALKWELRPTLFTGNARYIPCFEIDPDTSDFVLQSEVLIFCRTDVPTNVSRDFMKRFTNIGLLNGIKAYPSDDGRQLNTAIDWQEEIKVSNSNGIAHLTATT